MAPLGVYTATKIAAVGLMEALRVELEGTTVGTSAFVPGGVNTDNYVDTGEVNPYRAAQAAARAAANPNAPVRQNRGPRPAWIPSRRASG
ncbi:MAG: SDR family NAD(P)-dependent oxidoreductase [Steroidobacteraceae bacterium]